MKRIWFVLMVGVLVAGNGFAMSRSEKKPLVVVLMGPPGAGKGTHAGPLSEHLGIPHISTGDLFREHIRSQSLLGVEAKKYIDQGKLVPDELVLNMLFARVSAPDCKNGYILDGFPRTLSQAQALDNRLGSQHQLAVLNLNLSDETIVQRVTGRIACKECGRPFHKTYDPPQKEGVCDQCNGPLLQREDDREEVVCKRLEVYRNQTQPLLAYYAQKEGLKEIDSQKTKEQVFHNVLEALPLMQER